MSVIDDIKDRLDIVDLVSETVKLRKSGRTFTGFCPFHSNTRTPSFVVWPESGTWKCFGACNTGGDAFSYIMKRDGLEFREALEELARRTGIELPEPNVAPEVTEERDRLRDAVEAAAKWFNHLLMNNPQAQSARDHLNERGISESAIVDFQLGYALNDWHALENFLKERSFSQQELIDAGLLIQRDDGNVYDRFRNRVMIPIHDWKGRPIGFGARTLNADDHPKYLNSPQTDLFDKSKTLYALHMAKKAIREVGHAVIVEGYMDAIAAHQAGFNNVVASLGTALTEMQFKQLQKLAPRIVLALDADEAGINAMLRGLDVARESLDREMQPMFDPRGLIGFEGKLKIDMRVLTLPEHLDPDDILRNDRAQWVKLIDEAKPVAKFVIDTLAAGRNLNNPKEKDQLVESVRPFINDIASPIERASYAQYIARLIKVPEHAVTQRLQPTRESTTPRRRRASDAPQTVADEPSRPLRHTRDATITRERYCLHEMLRVPHALYALDQLLARAELLPFSAEDFDDTAHRAVFSALQNAIEQIDRPSVDEVLEYIDPALRDDVQTWLATPPLRPSFDEAIDETRGTIDAALLLRERNLKSFGAQLEALIRNAAEDQDHDSIRELSQAKLALSGQLQRLSRIRYAPELIRHSPGDIGR